MSNVVSIKPPERASSRNKRATPFGIRVGTMLRHERAVRGISLEDVAEQCDFTWQFLQHLEAGRRLVNIDHLLQISRAIGFNPVRFIQKICTDEGTSRDETPVLLALLAEPGVSKLLATYGAMSANQRRILLNTAKALADNGDR